MKVNLTIEATNQEEINAIFAALAGLDAPTTLCTGKLVTTPAPVKTAIAVPPAESSTTQEVEDATPNEPAEEQDKPLSPSEIKKREISEAIIALGGIPPVKGAVKKFQEVFDSLKVEAEETPEETPEETNEGEDVDIDEITADDADTGAEEGDEISLDDVRTLAHAVVKSTPEDPALGKSKLGACLKQVHAASLTKATQQQLKQIIPLLEKNIGKTMSEVVAEAN